MIFGMRAMKVDLMDYVIFPLIQESSTTLSISLSMMSNKDINNSIDHPSGPGILSFLNHFRVASSSSREIALHRSSSSSHSMNLIKSWATLMLYARFNSLVSW